MVESLTKNNIKRAPTVELSIFLFRLASVVLSLIFAYMPASLSALTPEEKIEKYNQLNGAPDPGTYVKYTPTATPSLDMPKATDYMSTQMGALPSVLAPTADPTTPKQPQTKPSLFAPKTQVPISNDPSKYITDQFPAYTPTSKSLNFNDFEQRIRMHESQDDPGATNKHSSASGYYQFLWNDWHDSIKNVTGINNRQQFLDSPDAQKQFFRYYYDNHIMPNVTRIKKDLGNNLPINDFDLAQLIHFQGASKAEQLLKSGNLNSKTESYNPTPLQYIQGK